MVKIVIPMSGEGSRFRAAGYTALKPLITVDGQPMIQHVIEMFSGEKEFILICNREHLVSTELSGVPGVSVHEVLSDLGRKLGLELQIIAIPPHKLGPVHAVNSALIENLNLISDDEEVIVTYCDYGTYWSYSGFLNDCRARHADGAIAAYKGFHPHMLGTDNYAFMKEADQAGSRWMERIQEKKPFTDNRMSEYASNGTYYFRTGAILKHYFAHDDITIVNNEKYVSMVYNLLVADGLKVSIFEIEHMLQWGTPYDLQVYQDWSTYFSNIIKPQRKLVNPMGTLSLIPMAGLGSRFSKNGYTTPKPILDVCGYPMVVQAVKCLPVSENTAFVCLNDHITRYNIDNILIGSLPETKVSIVKIDTVTQGQACSCEVGLDALKINDDTPLLITACDNAAYYDVDEYEKLLNDQEVDVIVWSFSKNPTSKNKPDQYSWIEKTGDNTFVKTHVKRCPFDNPYEEDAIIGTFFFRKTKYFREGLKRIYYKDIRASNGEFYIDNLLNELPELRIKVFRVTHYICWGMPDEYETYLYWQRYFDKAHHHPYSVLEDVTRNQLA